MRMMSQAVHRPLLPALVALALLVACDATTGPERAPSPELASNGEALAARGPEHGLNIIEITDRETFAPPGGWFTPSGPLITCGAAGTFSKTYSGTGTMTHAGRDSSFAEWQTCGIEAGHLVVRGTGTIFTASGDAMYATFVQTFNLVSAEAVTFDIALTTTGGTGRFEGATGAASGVGSRQGSVASWQLTGTIFLAPKH